MSTHHRYFEHNNSACTEGAVCIIASHCIIVHTWGGGTAPLVLARVNIKHFGLLTLWGQRLMEPTGPTEQVICITPWPWVLAGHSHTCNV